ncbi:M56 family metallopeptidase [Rubripirellula reticaptiva]|uniref:Regulatory protein BlaR1 n=1 Tax=Rubripirellula reticaptiva TaxID=2528013 RepID=A0A5C6ETQ6_9BACT|nr:M56 family metallopeptidase [Rubripirellula reticaptiva]TWU51690.1 Regulatory protein BlaR1 [Rubripirellula reticaptiva]
METVFDWVAGFLANQSCQLIVVFAIAVVGAWLLKNQSAHWRYLLWLLVIGKCLTPSLISVPVGVLPASSDAVVSTLTIPSMVVDGSVASKPRAQSFQQTSAATARTIASVVDTDVDTQVTAPVSLRLATVKPKTSINISAWLVLGWIVGTTVFLTVLFGKMFETQWRLRRLRVPAEEETQSFVASIAGAMSLWRAPKVYVVASSSQPFVFGWLRGDVYLPAGFKNIESVAQRRAILTHELAHVGRWDLAINLVQMFIQAIFFFHPAVWWANRKVREEREKCCDEFVLSDSKTSPKLYCEAIVQLLDLERNFDAFQSVLAVGGSTKNIEDRICTMLSGTRKFRRRPSLAALVVLGTIAAIALPSTIVVTNTTAVAAMPQEATSESPADSPETTTDPKVDWDKGQTMEFRVIHSETKEPIPDVDLELQYMGKGIDFNDVKVQTTDAEGKSIITLPDLPIKSMRVYPSKPGFVPLRVYWESEPTPVLPKTISIPLDPGNTIGGTIVDEDGKPVAGARVSMHYWEESTGKALGDSPHVRVNICDSNYNCKGIATSDKDGRWKLDILPKEIDKDRFHLYFQHPSFISDHSVRGLTSRSIYEAPPLQKLFDSSAVVTMKKGRLVQGIITNEDGRPVPSAKIFAFLHDHRIDEPIATTEGDGKFKFSAQAVEVVGDQAWSARSTEAENFLVEAKGYAPELFGLQDGPLFIKLKPGKTLRGRVVDELGKPLEKATVWAQNWRGKRGRLRVEAKTNADGRFVVEDLPADVVDYDVGKQGKMSIDETPMIAGEKEYTLTLTPPLTVKVNVTDAETRMPIKDLTYMMGFEYDDGRAPDWQLYPKPRVLTGTFEKVFSQTGFPQRIRVEADGYEPGISRTIEAKRDDKKHTLSINLKLKKGNPVTGSVNGVDGKPLANAKVILARTRINVSKRDEQVYDGENPVTTTDGEGKFQFPPETEKFSVVVIHKNGIGMVTEKDLVPDTPIQIEPWDDKNEQMQIIRLPAEMQHSDFPKYDPFEERRKREKAKQEASPASDVPAF